MELVILSAIIGLHFAIEVCIGNSSRAFGGQLDQGRPEGCEADSERLGAREFATGLLPLLLLPAGLGLLEPARAMGLAVLLLSVGLLAAGRMARARA